MRMCELRQKEVINICSCRSLGCVSDVEIDICTGFVTAIIIPGPGRVCSFLGRDTEFIIPWECIRQIGSDIILVEMEEEKCRKKCE
ncbi:MAG: YlmC/YmxH family sporulation protein [Firmicutes bacterium]|nr:YlmC/YmxH family sporulation protein [Lachnospiraceae bacterium]MDD6066625.1 YlmC/YmxH family sporulation protein [Bacillota bacterium]MDY2820420.1 YlmC/YmxH family sporulation protein [Hominisplanchenecus sp.]